MKSEDPTGATIETGRRRSSIRRKTMLVVVVALVAAVSASLALLFVVDARRDADDRTRDLLRRAHVYAYAVGVAAGDGRLDEVQRILRAMRQTAPTRAGLDEADSRSTTLVFTATTGQSVGFFGAPLLDTDVSVTPEEPTVSLIALLDSRMLQAVVPVVNETAVVGRLALAVDASEFAERLRDRLLLTLGGLVPGLALGLLIAGRMAGRIVRPIAEMTRAAEEIRDSHDYSRRVEVDTTDEVGALADGFNAMLDEIGKRDRSLAAHRRTLESDVATRTREYLEAKNAAEAANAAKSEFLATMSHEIRTPLTGIMAMAELLESSGISGRQRRYADVIAKSGRSLLAIINDVLDLSKIEAGRMELEAIAASPAEILDQVAGLFAERARSKGLDLATFVDPATPRFIRTDPTRLSQVIANLVNNALKFTEAGGVLVEAGPVPGAGDRLAIRVADTGPGIPADKLDAVFEAFRQADASTTRRHGGTGLGLSIARKIVLAMDGSLTVESRAGEGATFVVTIPILDPVAPDPWPSARAARSFRIEGLPTFTGRVLARYLEASGHASAADGTPDLLILGGDALPAEPPAAGATVVRIVQPGQRDDGTASLESPVRVAEIRALLRALLNDAVPSQPAVQTAPDTDGPPGDYAHVRVLVVDDNAVNREVALAALARFRIVADVAEDGAAAVACLGRTRYDLVFMDGSMPVMDGFEATRRIRAREAQERLPPVAIVAFTAQVVGADSRRWREVGVDAELPKPFSLSGLAALLARFCEARPTAAPGVAAPAGGPASSAGDPDLLDGETLQQMEALRQAGRPDFGLRIATLYGENGESALAALDAAVRTGDRDAARRAAHALKSMSHSAGARRAAEAAGDLEAAFAAGDDPSEAALAAVGALARKSAAALLARFGEKPDAAAHDDPAVEDLAAGLAHGEIVPFFQPVVEARTGRVIGCEALVRWRRSGAGLISPAVFIPLAERSGLIGEVGRAVLTAGARSFARRPDLKLCVNASPRELEREDYMDHVERILRETGLPPARLELEVTESALFDAETVVIPNLQRARALGISIALDDFGTGYSSLSLLKNFPFDTIKIDRSFAADAHVSIEARAIVEAVVQVARTLGKSITAEGIERPEQQQFLAGLGIHHLQGYLFGRPAEGLPAPDGYAVSTPGA